MIKDLLKEKEPVAYLSLKNDLNENKIAHSYLLYGELNPLKTEAAFLLAQSIIENKNDFACEECDTCRRIKENKYFDVVYINGYEKTIKKEDIEYIMEEFSKTSLEKANIKVYIITNINNSSPKVLNMILKFMEEPSNEDTFGIFTSDNLDSLLPTVVSRCQKIPFMTRDFSNLIQDYRKAGFDGIDAYLLSNIKHQFVQDFDLNDEKYLAGKEYVYKTIENLNNRKYIPVLFSREFYSSVGRDDFKETSDYFLSIMMIMLEDALSNKLIDDSEYNDHLNMLKEAKTAKLMEIISNAIDKTSIAVNRQLLFDQIASQILSY